MSKTIIESLIPFITNMMNNQKEVRESGEPVIDLRGVKFLIKEPHPANLDIPDVQFWYSLVGSDASAVSKVKCTFKSHWIEPTESVENITWYDEIVWEFSAHNNSLVANCDSMNAMDSSTADVSGTVSELCYSDRGDVEEYHEEDIKANLLYELYDIAIDDFSGYGDDFAVDTCEAELTLGARTLTVPVVCELDRIFTGEISSAER